MSCICYIFNSGKCLLPWLFMICSNYNNNNFLSLNELKLNLTFRLLAELLIVIIIDSIYIIHLCVSNEDDR